MLVLSRKLNEKIVIDGGITLTVVKIDRNQVRLGIEAPGDVSIQREELLRRAEEWEVEVEEASAPPPLRARRKTEEEVVPMAAAAVVEL